MTISKVRAGARVSVWADLKGSTRRGEVVATEMVNQPHFVHVGNGIAQVVRFSLDHIFLATSEAARLSTRFHQQLSSHATFDNSLVPYNISKC